MDPVTEYAVLLQSCGEIEEAAAKKLANKVYDCVLAPPSYFASIDSAANLKEFIQSVVSIFPEAVRDLITAALNKAGHRGEPAPKKSRTQGPPVDSERFMVKFLEDFSIEEPAYKFTASTVIAEWLKEQGFELTIFKFHKIYKAYCDLHGITYLQATVNRKTSGGIRKVWAHVSSRIKTGEEVEEPRSHTEVVLASCHLFLQEDLGKCDYCLTYGTKILRCTDARCKVQICLECDATSDWVCPGCKNHNASNKVSCKRCGSINPVSSDHFNEMVNA